MRTGWWCSALWHGLSPAYVASPVKNNQGERFGRRVGFPYLVTTYRAGFCRHCHLCCSGRPHTFLLINTTSSSMSCRKQSHALAIQKAACVVVTLSVISLVTEKKLIREGNTFQRLHVADLWYQYIRLHSRNFLNNSGLCHHVVPTVLNVWTVSSILTKLGTDIVSLEDTFSFIFFTFQHPVIKTSWSHELLGWDTKASEVIYISSSSFLGAFTKLRKATISFVISACPCVRTKWLGFHWNFMKFDIWVFFENLSWKFKFH
jgi:hypothetical protein